MARGGPRVVYNKLLGGWYVVVGPHQTPLNGRFNSKVEAEAWLNRSPQQRARNPIKEPGKFEGELYVTRYAHENPDDEIGSVDELNWFGRFSGKVKGRGPFHIITEENSQGFVWGKLYDTEKEMMKAWHEVEREYDQFYEQQEQVKKNPVKEFRWRYVDARGVKREGVFEKSFDYGGTDVTYQFRRDDGGIDMVSGSRLKQAERIWPK